MEKTLLKSVIFALDVGSDIVVQFRNGTGLENLSGPFTVLDKRKGRGKGGSMLATLRPKDTDGPDIEIGTPKNENILNITVSGQLYGYENEAVVPVNYETNADNSVVLKEQFKRLLNAEETRPMVEIQAPGVPTLNGNFTVVEARQLRGRAGQVVLCLENEAGDRHEVWSYRHSGVVQKFTVVGP